MRWLVTGGAGFLGINLVRHLLARRESVVSLDREPFDYPERSQISEVRGDIRDRAVVVRAAAGCDVVVHAAAALPLYPPAEIHSIDVDGTRTVLDAAREVGSRVVHVSSTAVYGVPDHHPLVEADRMHGVGPYGIAKVEAEHECTRARERGQIVPVIRPKSFVGPERLGVFALMYEWAREGRDFPILGRGDNRYQLLDVEDLCDALYLAGTLPNANDTFNVGAAKFTTLREDFQSVLDAAGRGGKIRSLPVAPAIWTLRVLERAKLSPLYPWIYETVTEDSFVSIDRARERLGWEPKFSNRDALVRNYEWYCANVDKLGKAGVTHRVPWKQGALAMAKLVFRPHAS